MEIKMKNFIFNIIKKIKMGVKSLLNNMFYPRLSNIFLYGYYLRFIFIFYEEHNSIYSMKEH